MEEKMKDRQCEEEEESITKIGEGEKIIRIGRKWEMERSGNVFRYSVIEKFMVHFVFSFNTKYKRD